MMRKLTALSVMVVALMVLVTSASAQGHRVGAGVNVMSPDGVLDDGYGLYASYMFDVSDMLATYVGVSQLSGDYDLTISGDDRTRYMGGYKATQLEAAFLVQWAKQSVVPYAGVGGGYSFISFDNMNVGDKLSLFYMFGLVVPVSDNLSFDASARLNYLRPRSYNPYIETVDMDGWLFRLGITWEL